MTASSVVLCATCGHTRAQHRTDQKRMRCSVHDLSSGVWAQCPCKTYTETTT